MKAYLDILQRILDEGTRKPTRTGIDTLSISGVMFEHDMRTGFPLVTTKKVSIRFIAIELECFIQGITDKTWLKKRGCTIWNEWSRIDRLDFETDEKRKAYQLECDDLGPIYGYQWRRLNMLYAKQTIGMMPSNDSEDQLNRVVRTLKENPLDRRMIVSAWNPLQIDQMALPPCHWGFQVLSDGENIDLLYNIRSWDFPLGGPYNIASYALLLILLGKEAGLCPRYLKAFGGDVHIYANQIDSIKEQLTRVPFSLPILQIGDFDSIWEWRHDDIYLVNYEHHAAIRMQVAV